MTALPSKAVFATLSSCNDLVHDGFVVEEDIALSPTAGREEEANMERSDGTDDPLANMESVAADVDVGMVSMLDEDARSKEEDGYGRCINCTS